jgi:uroporphyrinogen decarboxylase
MLVTEITKKTAVKPKEHVFAALQHQQSDRIPRFEIWIDALLDELGQKDAAGAYVNLGQDAVMMPSQMPPNSNAWQTGIDEWGRIWKNGMYTTGAIDTEVDLDQYTPPLVYAEQFFDRHHVQSVKTRYPDHCLIFGTHIGPFTMSYLAMGFERFFLRLIENPAFAHKLLSARTQWAIALFQQAVRLGAEVIIVGDDAAHNDGPMISPQMWREFVLPYHRQIVDTLDVPVIWHSDGNVVSLLSMAIEAGFVGFHGLEPAAGVNLIQVKQEFGRDLVLIGNIDVRVLCNSNLSIVRNEVDRCLAQGSPDGGFMLATCNSIFAGMNPLAVAELFRYEHELLS